MEHFNFIKTKFKNLDEGFHKELLENAVFITVDAKTELIKEGQKISHIPILISGLAKVFTLHDGKELLYYYIEPNEGCTMTFSSIFTDKTSRIYAVSEEKSEVMLMPVSQLLNWLIKYPELNQYFFLEYDQRYKVMMDTISQVVFQRLDKRILEYLDQRIKRHGATAIKISHKKIADDLGTAREVVSRILKKYEKEGVIIQGQLGIEILKKV
ncbi:Crp/Fnr family transcriptional regulator [Epilithonimonas sp. JDS]|uniref:Crp/Fnr family transcriptional regulator n=1 Tax=Epilithonimonas sp. JDS TaxID=2902797 RepID=UPI001E2F7A7C|nr:Crp/Fnr family transcriptional regulator [Epilithonimonas sp. JDS]MCD9856230.1 Crp/Fnr family transcriptional regulator [Epilithonimonas sp. JDS]